MRTARGWVLVAAPVLTVMSFVVVLMAATIVAMLEIKPMPSPAAVQAFVRQMETSPIWVQGLTILQDMILVFVIWLLLPKRGPAAMSGYFARVSPVVVVFAAITGALLALTVSYGYGVLELRHVVTFHVTAGERALVPQSAPELAPSFVTIALVAPFAEELYFRGVLLRWLRTKMRVVWAALLSASLFALIHLRFVGHPGMEGWLLTGGIAALGLINAIWAAGARSLWPSIAAHGTYNAAIISLPLLAHYLPP